MITGFVFDPIYPIFIHNTSRHIYFEGSATSKQNMKYNTHFCSKKVLDHELPALSYMPTYTKELIRYILF